MATTSSPANASAIRFVLVLKSSPAQGSNGERYPGGNIAVPEGVDARTFAETQALKLGASTGSWVVWSDGNRPIILPARDVRHIEVEYLDGF